MQLFLKFKDHPECFFSDRTIQTYLKTEKVKSVEARVKEAQKRNKKRKMKVHRKELVEPQDLEDSKLQQASTIARAMVNSSAKTMGLIGLGLTFYGLKAAATSCFKPGLLCQLVNTEHVLRTFTKLF